MIAANSKVPRIVMLFNFGHPPFFHQFVYLKTGKTDHWTRLEPLVTNLVTSTASSSKSPPEDSAGTKLFFDVKMSGTVVQILLNYLIGIIYLYSMYLMYYLDTSQTISTYCMHMISYSPSPPFHNPAKNVTKFMSGALTDLTTDNQD